MSERAATTEIELLLDGRAVKAQRHEPLLSVAERNGVAILSLCHHRDLAPLGACRLCLVEVEERGRRKLVTACTFPAEEGIRVTTRTEAILKHRRMVLELLLARSPNVPAIRKIAEEHGVVASRFVSGDETCILCGLCTRVCETFATSAITSVERGDKKAIGTFAAEPPADCVGCGACAAICPTGHIVSSRSPGILRIWDRDFKLATCVVDRARCRACGVCAEACPFSIPRIVVERGGDEHAAIDIEACRGCGVCLAACPAGAIEQPRARRDLPRVTTGADGGRALVVACGRSCLGTTTSQGLPDRVELLMLPCSGGAGLGLLVTALARRYDGVLVLGRHEGTCRLSGAERHLGSSVDRANALAEIVGLGASRVAFDEPRPGREGPALSIARFLEGLVSSPLREAWNPSSSRDSLDDASSALTWLSERAELVADGATWLARHGLPAAEPGKPVLLAAAVPYLDLLLGDRLLPYRLGDLLLDGLAVLAALGIEAGVAVGGLRAGEARLASGLPGSTFYSLCDGCKARVEAAGGACTSMNQLIAARGRELLFGTASRTIALDPANDLLQNLAKALSFAVTAVLPAPETGLRLAVSTAERRALEGRFVDAGRAGAVGLLVGGPVELVQHLLQRRDGSWRKSHVAPMLASTLVRRFALDRRSSHE